MRASVAGSGGSVHEPVAPSHSVPYARIDSMIGTSARPFSVSSYSTRGGTSGKVWRATMPSSSSERRRRLRRPRRDALQRALELAEALAAVGQVADHEERPLAADDSAVRQTGQSELGTNAILAQDFNY